MLEQYCDETYEIGYELRMLRSEVARVELSEPTAPIVP
jgi:hypothetical protein